MGKSLTMRRTGNWLACGVTIELRLNSSSVYLDTMAHLCKRWLFLVSRFILHNTLGKADDKTVPYLSFHFLCLVIVKFLTDTRLKSNHLYLRDKREMVLSSFLPTAGLS